MTRILALDLGTSTGFAYDGVDGGSDSAPVVAGTWKLATAKEIGEWHRTRMDRRCDPRPGRLAERVETLLSELRFDVVIFEDVEFQTYTLQCQLWSSLRAAVWLASKSEVVDPARPIVLECVPVGTLKKFATGHGGATKEMMWKALLRAPGGGEFLRKNPIDDNAVDAIHLWRWGKTNLGRLAGV